MAIITKWVDLDDLKVCLFIEYLRSISTAEFNGLKYVLVRTLPMDRRFPLFIACQGAKDLGPAKVVLDEGRLSGGVVQDGSFVMFVKASFWHRASDYILF